MSQSVHLFNDTHGIVALPMIRNVIGKPVVLRPTGHPGDSDECFIEVLKNPHVQNIIKAKWVHVGQPAAPAPTPAPSPPPAPPMEFQQRLATPTPEPKPEPTPEPTPKPPAVPPPPSAPLPAPKPAVAQDTLTAEPLPPTPTFERKRRR